MNRPLLLFLLLFAATLTTIVFLSEHAAILPAEPPRKPVLVTLPVQPSAALLRLHQKAADARRFAKRQGLCLRYAFLLDLGLPSGRKRFFVYDLKADTVLNAGLVPHGSCNTRFLETAQFSNKPGCGCSSVGHYKVGGAYEGRFGTAFKLHGLDSTNSSAFARNVVLHAYSRVPDEESLLYPICNSLGCPMVSYHFLDTLTGYIHKAGQPIMLWVYN